MAIGPAFANGPERARKQTMKLPLSWIRLYAAQLISRLAHVEQTA